MARTRDGSKKGNTSGFDNNDNESLSAVMYHALNDHVKGFDKRMHTDESIFHHLFRETPFSNNNRNVIRML